MDNKTLVKHKKNKNNLYSFDIFDTLVTRRTATPFGVFAIIQDILKTKTNIDTFFCNNFYKIRIGAEEFARLKNMQIKKCTEVNINEIYQIIKDNYNLSFEEIQFLKNLEIDTEIKNLLPIQNNIELLKNLIKSGERVVLISDMYYGAKDLRNLLNKIDPIFDTITIYSSADYCISKSEGKLYNIVKKEEGIYSEWHHYGDNKHSDIKKAKECNIKPHYCPQVDLMEYELNILKNHENNKFFQCIIGSAKLARRTPPSPKNDKYNFGASFAAPILYNYVDWVLNQSLKKGFKTIYFVARDGYTPKIVADIIIERRKLNLKTKYLYGSRLAWRKPTTSNFDELMDWMFEEYGNDITPEFLGYRLGVDSQEITKMLGLKSPTSKTNKTQRLLFAEKFKNNQDIRNRLIDLNKENTQLLLSYFKQEIDFSEKNIAFVDLHGSGRTQDCVASLLNEIAPCTVYSFYLTNSLMNQTENSIKLCYFATLKYLSHWIELLCRTTDGQTIGYKKNGNIIVPITEKGNGKSMMRWGFNEYIEGIKAFTNYMIDVENSNQINLNTIDLFCGYFDYLKEDLDRKTANIMGDIPYKAIGNEEYIECAAPKIPLYKLLLNFILCRKPKPITEFENISFARSSKFTKKFRKLLEECPTLQKLLLNVYVHKKTQTAYIRILGIKISFRRLLWRNK